ncbi:hypothetical protein BBJ28_00003520 [Nothophytophthora sp. Chile5]|nr:hypothetical protein BBJ28_00003520 [Nothophytophthora sp. Chile5]
MSIPVISKEAGRKEGVRILSSSSEMDPHAMGMQGGMSMPMSMGMAMSSGASGGNPQGLGMNAMAMNPAQYGVAPQQQQQQMMMNMNAMNGMNPMAMNSVGMQMNPNAMNAASVSGGMQVGGGQSVAGADWRIQLTREHRANLIAKIYNQMVRVSADPVPGIKLWMNVSWYELTLYRESPTQEVYINKIFTRLKSLRAQQSDMNAAMAAQALPNQGMLSRLDFSYYSTLNQQNQRPAAPAVNGGQVGGYPGHPQQFGGPAPHPGVQQQQQQQPGQAMASGTTNGPAAQAVKPESDMPANVVAGYWRQHAALRAKHQDDVEKVHSAFKKYVDHMKGHDETEQKKKLRYLLSYVELCANILSEDKTTHAPRKIEELDKVFKYIVKIVNPYLKKLRTETDKRSTTPGASTGPSLAMPTPSGSNSAYMDFPNALSPTNFSGMDLLDWEDGSAQGDLSPYRTLLQALRKQRRSQSNKTRAAEMATSVSPPPAPPPPRVNSTASMLHVTASDISLFSRDDDDDGSEPSSSREVGDDEERTPAASDEDEDAQLAARALANEQQEGDAHESLGQELLEALRLGTSNFLLAYNTRAGIAALLRVFKLLQKREFAAATDLRQLLDERHLAFRVEAVRLGLFLGWFTGGYRGLRALLPVLLRRILPQKHPQHETRVRELSAVGSGAIAALALGFVDAKRRRSLALYALTRALQCGYNTAKRQQRWHFWGSDWRFGDALLFALSSAQVMYAYVMRPKTLPPEYFRFIQRTGPVELETLELVQQINRALPISTATFQHLLDRKPGIPKDFPLPSSLVPCRLVHCDADSCLTGTALCFKRAFLKTFPLYLSLFIVPGVVIHFKRFLRTPFRSLARSALNATRSNCFLASFVSLYLALICLHRRVVSKDHRFIYYLAGLGASTTILMEPKSRRSGTPDDRGIACLSAIRSNSLCRFTVLWRTELALYVLPRAIDSLAMILHDRGIFSGFAYGEVALFSASMSVMMYCYETSTDKKHLYQASLEQKERRCSQSQAQMQAGAEAAAASSSA